MKINDINYIEKIFADRKAGHEDFFKEFSVLLPLVPKDGNLYVLYEVRARHMETQPGEVCFPGGEMEDGESPRECALRETWEEIGIAEGDIRIIGQLDTVITYSNFAMYGFLGIINEAALDRMKLSEDEVERVMLIPLQKLIDEEPRVYWTEIVPQPPEDFPYGDVTGGEPYKWRHGKAPVPVYKEMDGEVLWGLTARITKGFVDIIKGGKVDV